MLTREDVAGAVVLMMAIFCMSAAQAGQQDKEYSPFGVMSKGEKIPRVNMHLQPEGKWKVGEDKWGKIVRVNTKKISGDDWQTVPGVEKAWPMQGYEGIEGMAFHPIISEVKDIDGDGVPEVFRCRSEHKGARIERLSYEDGSVIWESEPVGALHGDESRLPVFDLDGDGVHSVIYPTSRGTWCINAETGETEWIAREAVGEVQIGHFLNRDEKGIVVRVGPGLATHFRGADPPGNLGKILCFDADGKLAWQYDTGLRGEDATNGHEMLSYDANGDGLDEVFVNWNKLTLALGGDGSVLWKDETQQHHSDGILCADLDADGETEFIYDHEGCTAAQGPLYVVDAMTGEIEQKVDYQGQGVGHAQNMAVGDFLPDRKGLELAFCGKRSNIFLFDSDGQLQWKRRAPTSLLSQGDWDGDGAAEIMAFGIGVNVDGIFSVWNGQGERLYAMSFLPSPSRRTWSDEHLGGSWSHAMPGGHDGIRVQRDLDGDGRAEVIMPFGSWHWGADSILFLMEKPTGQWVVGQKAGGK